MCEYYKFIKHTAMELMSREMMGVREDAVRGPFPSQALKTPICNPKSIRYRRWAEK